MIITLAELKDYKDYFAAAGVIGGGLWAVFQYTTNIWDQKSARARAAAVAAADEIEAFNSDDVSQQALDVIDYCERFVSSNNTRSVIATDTFCKALAYHGDKSINQDDICSKILNLSQEEQSIRDSFDHLLQRLERVDNLIERQVINREDFAQLFCYWLQLMGERDLPGDTLNHFSNRRRYCLWRFIRSYRYDGVVRLFARYGRAGKIGDSVNVAFMDRSGSEKVERIPEPGDHKDLQSSRPTRRPNGGIAAEVKEGAA